jgi:hypothetical protein
VALAAVLTAAPAALGVIFPVQSCNGGYLLSFSDGSTVIDSKWRTGNPADRVVPLANGQTGLCRFGSPPCLIPPNEATNFIVFGNYCDPWPYEDEPR